MTASPEPANAPQLPSWPLNCLTFYRHMAEDYARYIQALGGAANPVQTARAENAYGVSLMQDLTQAWYDLALSPFTAMAKVMTAEPATAGDEPGSRNTAAKND